MTTEISNYDATWILQHWLRWEFISDDYFSGGLPTLGQLAAPRPVRSLLTDDEAMTVARLFWEFQKKHPEDARAVKAYYRQGRSFFHAGEQLNIPRTRITLMITRGIAWLDGRIKGEDKLNRVRDVYSQALSRRNLLRPPGPAKPVDVDNELVALLRKSLV